MEAMGYADDTAVVIEDSVHDLPIPRTFIRRFAKVSGLTLNLPESKVIPLGTSLQSWFPNGFAAIKILGTRSLVIAGALA